MLSNFFYTFLAPFFVIFEIMNFLGGYKADEVKKCKVIIAKEVDAFRKSKKL